MNEKIKYESSLNVKNQFLYKEAEKFFTRVMSVTYILINEGEKMKENEFKVQAVKSLQWYRKRHKTIYTERKIGEKLHLDISTISKNLSVTNNEKSLVSLERAIDIAEAMDSNLWTIMYQYELYKTEENEKKCKKFDEKENLKVVSNKFEKLLVDANDPRFKPWMGEYYCYFSSTSSSEINKKKKEADVCLQEKSTLFNITPSNDHIFCGIMTISKEEDLCKVEFEFMADKKKHNVKHYCGTLRLSSQYAAGFIEMTCAENGECTYIIANSPDSGSLECRMAMVLTLSSIDRHRRACAEKMFISQKEIKEGTAEYEALKAFLPMNDSHIYIHEEEYGKLINELKNTGVKELQSFADKYSDLSKLVSNNSVIDICKYVSIPESIISNLKSLSDENKNKLRIYMRKHSIANWYYKANNKNAEDILNIINE